MNNFKKLPDSSSNVDVRQNLSKVCGSSFSAGIESRPPVASCCHHVTDAATPQPAEIPKCRMHSSRQQTHTLGLRCGCLLQLSLALRCVSCCLLPQLRCSALPGTVPGAAAYLPSLVMHPRIIPDKSKPVLNQKAYI